MADYTHESYWPQIKALAEAGKYTEIENVISLLPDPTERIALFRFAIRGLMFRDWIGKNLKPIIQLGDLAIETALKLDKTDEANIICYNMSANLTNCWNDNFERTEDHFKKGLQYADQAVEFRKQLKKGPGPLSMAYWAKGAHLLFLRDFPSAEENFNLSLKYAIEEAVAANQPTSISKNASFSVLTAYGYLALAQIARWQSQAQEIFDQVISSFEEMKEISEDAKADAEIGLDQLRFVRTKFNNPND